MQIADLLYRGTDVIVAVTTTTPTSAPEHVDRIGTIPTAISTVLTAMALLFTGSVFFRDRRKQRRDQAVLVYAWLEKGEEKKDEKTELTGVVTVEVKNASDHPIWEIEVALMSNGRTLKDPVKTSGPARLRPQGCGTWTWQLTERDGLRRGELTLAVSPDPELKFKDAAGRRWKKAGPVLKRA